MAHLEVKRKSRSSLWLWLIIVIIILAAVAYWYTQYYRAPTALIMNNESKTTANFSAAIPRLINHLS
ncbi:MAG TPA: hypothetical protein VGN20_01510 [Mucilaginibacter sp.]|jgi:flagellar basal body-associated protein FliL